MDKLGLSISRSELEVVHSFSPMASFTATNPKCSFFCVSPVYRYSRRSQLASFQPIRAVNSAEPENQNPTTQTKTEQPSATPPSSTAKEASNSGPARPKKPVYSMKKGQIVRVDKEKYLNSINYLSVGHPPYYKGLDYIYEDRGEVLDLRIFETGEYALVSWVGIPTAPAWLPTDMLIKSDKLNYERL